MNTREPLIRFLIVCEGAKTGPDYFESFRVPSVTIDVVGIGQDPLAVVKHAIGQRGHDRFDEVWCVFDRDDVSAGRFNQALVLARQSNIKIACSNQAFELWYLLHFQYCDVAQTRQAYCDGLGLNLGRAYRKNDLALYGDLLPRQGEAIRNADRLLSQYDPHNPALDDPSTTVHKLVLELNRFVQESRFS